MVDREIKQMLKELDQVVQQLDPVADRDLIINLQHAALCLKQGMSVTASRFVEYAGGRVSGKQRFARIRECIERIKLMLANDHGASLPPNEKPSSVDEPMTLAHEPLSLRNRKSKS